MKNFNEWLMEKDKELYEGIIGNLANSKSIRKLIAAGAIASAGYGLATDKPNNTDKTSVNDFEDEDGFDNMENHQKKLLAAAKRAGVPSNEWNRLKGQSRGGVIITVNGRKVPLTQKEKQDVNAAIELARRMGNDW